MADTPRVLIVDDHSFFRSGLRSVLTAHGFEVVGEADSGEAALQMIDRRLPEVVLMDLNMPGMSGVEATRAVCRRPNPPAIVVLTVSIGERDVIEALEAGAAGYLVKDAPPEEITRALLASLDGETPLSPRIARILVERARNRPPGADAEAEPAAALSDRELEVLRLLAEGMDNADIAAQLYISPTTVKHHVSRIFAKLGVANRVQAAIQAVRSGLL